MENRLAQRYLMRAIEASPFLSHEIRLIEVQPIGTDELTLTFSDHTEITVKIDMVR